MQLTTPTEVETQSNFKKLSYYLGIKYYKNTLRIRIQEWKKVEMSLSANLIPLYKMGEEAEKVLYIGYLFQIAVASVDH